MLALYNAAASTCSQKVRLALAEKGVSFVDRQVSLKDNEQLEPWYLELNPNGVVPTLVHDDRPIIDSSVINEYLDEVFPGVPLMPRDAFGRAQVRAWRQYTDEVSTPAIRVPSFNAFIVPTWNKSSAGWGEDRIKKTPLRKGFLRRLGPNGFGQADVDEALEKLTQTIKRLDTALQSGPWVTGDQFTLADISLVPTVTRMFDIGLATLWSDKPRVNDWFARVQRRPSFAATYYPGSRLSVVAMVPGTKVAAPAAC